MKHTLFTNIRFAQFQEPKLSLLLNVSGLLISRSDEKLGPLDPGNTLRGFGTDRFSFFLLPEALPYTLTQQTYSERYMISIGKDVPESLKPLFYGAMLTFTNGTSLFLQAEDSKHPIDVFEHDDILTIWQALFDRAIKYWSAPYMPHYVYGPPSKAEIFRRNQ